MSSTLLLAVLGLLGILGYLFIFAALHIMSTGYSPIRHAVSDYAVGDYGRLFRQGLILSSLGLLLLTIGLTRDPGAPPLAVSQLVFLFLVPVMRLGMVLFPTDLEGERLSRTGLIHYVFAIAAFAFTYAAIAGMTPRLTDLSPWRSVDGLLSTLHQIALVSLVLLVVTLVPRLRKIFGIFERAFLISTNAWFVTVGICLAIEVA